ncbi:MAG: hypothetical protein U1F43_09480 [Myxococcota bacterium]
MRSVVLCLASSLVVAFFASPASAETGADCAAVCEHRVSCGLAADGDDCADECRAVAPAYPSWAIAAYVHEGCAELRGDEPTYRNAVLAARACDHRAACTGSPDRDQCVADIVMAAYRDDVLSDYATWSCERVQQSEPVHHEIRQVVETCKHLLECEVPGDMLQCLRLAKENYFERHAYPLSQLEAWGGASCESLRGTVYIIPPAQAGSRGSSGWSSARSSDGWAPGWFGSWTDTRGNKVYHRPPGPGVF